MSVLHIRGVPIGDGKPKICMPLVGSDPAAILAAADEALALMPDIVEFRADYMQGLEESSLLSMLGQLRKLPFPLLFTLRDAAEGGAATFDAPDRVRLIAAALRSGLIDMVDIELFAARTDLRGLIAEAKARHVAVVLSAHFFAHTPSLEVMAGLLREMREIGADIAKLAVMPQTPADVLTILAVTEQMREAGPLITMSMGQLGLASRVIGGLFGSAVTFGAGGAPSAPGQLPVGELRAALALYY